MTESNGPRAPVIIVGGIFLILISLFGFAAPIARGAWAFALAIPGIAIVVLGARRPAIHMYERGLTRGRRHLAYESIRSIFDGNPLLYQPGRVKGRGFMAAVDSELMISDGNPFRIVRIRRTPEVYAVLEQHVLPRLVASWRARLEGGEMYKLGSSAILELKHTELWVPDPSNPMRPLLVQFRDIRVQGPYIYRRTGGDPVASHGALAGDLVLRALLASYGVPVA